MGSSFKPKKPSNKGQKELLRRQREEMREKDSEIAERRELAKNRGKGRASLMSGSETGVPQRNTLG